MGSYKVKRLDLPQNIIQILEKQNIHTCRDVLCLTLLELQTLLGISREQALILHTKISKKCVSEPYPVYDLYKNQRKLHKNPFFPLSLPSLDMLLHGGLLVGSVTELSGPPGVGKTQFCFMLCILATHPRNMGGLDGQIMYIDTESAFSATRLKKMAQSRYPAFYQSEDSIKDLLQRVFVHKAPSVCALKEIVPVIECEILKKKVKLVIIDSIASLFRKEYGASILQSVVERNNILLEQAAILKELAQTYDIVVFLTNQITSHSSDFDSSVSEYFSEEDKECNLRTSSDIPKKSKPVAKKQKTVEVTSVDTVYPALGVTWSHCVNTRLIAQFVDSHVRQIIIAKSPVAPNAAIKYILNETGVILTDDDIEYVNTCHAEKYNICTKYNFLNEDITGKGNFFIK